MPARAALAAAFRRGNLQVSLSVSGALQRETVRLNQEILDRLVEAGEALRERIGGEPLRADALLAIRGVVEVTSLPEEEDAGRAPPCRHARKLRRCAEGTRRGPAGGRARLHAILTGQVARIAELTQSARANPARSVEAVRARLAEQVSRLMETGAALDPDRLHQEAVLAATRADIQEELDRLDLACRGRAPASGRQ